MRARSTASTLLAGITVGALFIGGGYALGSGSQSTTITGCVVTRGHDGLSPGELLIRRRCSTGENKLTWSQQGPRGPQGVQGVQGVKGNPGQQGPAAASAWAYVNATPTPFLGAGQEHLRPIRRVHRRLPGHAAGFDAHRRIDRRSGHPVASSRWPDRRTDPSCVRRNTATRPAGCTFEVFTGYMSSGVFTPGNVSFSVAVFCKQT